MPTRFGRADQDVDPFRLLNLSIITKRFRRQIDKDGQGYWSRLIVPTGGYVSKGTKPKTAASRLCGNGVRS
jgi:hypothetical protein